MSPKAQPVAPARALDASVSSFRLHWSEAEQARERVRNGFDDARIIAALAGAADEWLDPASELRRRTIAALAAATKLHPDMLATGLELVFEAVNEHSLRALVAREAGTSNRRGPGTVFYALAGNVPGQAIPPIVASLLARSVAVIRDSARQPLLTEVFRQSVARVEPELAAMVVPVTWSSTRPTDEERALEQLLVVGSGRIELFGGDATVSALATRYAKAGAGHVARHATRLSVGIVPSATDLEAAADSFGIDVVMYEGRGCLTPHALLVEGPPTRASEFAEYLARALERLEKKWPRARGGLTEEAARRAYIDRAEAAALADVAMIGARIGRDATWCIRVGAAVEPIALGPGLRCVSVLATRNREASLAALSRATTPLAAVGVAGGDAASLADLESTLSPLGVTLVCAAGRMQAPPIHWEQDGRRRLGDLLEPKT